jgi:hypothetical protein
MQKQAFLAALLVGAACAPLALAAPPAFRTNTCPVKLNGTRLGTDLTPGGASLRNTIAYEPFTKLYHFWGFAADDANFPSAASSLRAVVHATSTDGLHFTSDSNLSYAFGSANYADYGAELDPPLDFFRAAFDDSTGTWKLFNWTENDQVVHPSFGSYNYNTSVDDLGTVASTTAVQHLGPLNTPVAGNHVGAFGLVDGNLYLRVDTGGGGDGQFAYTDGIPPSTGAEIGETDLFGGTPYCWFLVSGCGTSDPRIPAYVHNVGRSLRQIDGTIGTYYTFRKAADSSRLDKQIWYVESNDSGATWSAPTGVFANGNAIKIDHQPLDAAAGTANFSHAEVTQAGNVCRAYFSTQDANGAYVMVSATTGSACDALFADGFEGCGD